VHIASSIDQQFSQRLRELAGKRVAEAQARIRAQLAQRVDARKAEARKAVEAQRAALDAQVAQVEGQLRAYQAQLAARQAELSRAQKQAEDAARQRLRGAGESLRNRLRH
jgi:chromosome segregation ATPase